MSVPYQRYQHTVNSLLLDFQWIEELLRVITGCSYEILRRVAPEPVAFNPKKGALQGDALGRLVEKYSEVTRNTSLASDIRQLVKDRNFCAHKAFVLSLEEQEPENLEKEIERLTDIRSKSQKCVYALQEEFKIVAHALGQSSSGAANLDVPG